MAKEDIAVKQYLKVRERFADIYNANMFGGRQVIKPEELSEINAKVHYAMPVRGMLYDALSYTDQMHEIWEHLSEKERKEVDGAEFFSRFRKEDKLRPVVTLVFYYGEQPWDGSLELYDMFELENEGGLEEIRGFVANYKVKLVDASMVEDLSLYQSDLKEVLGFVKCRSDKERLLTYANENREFFESVDYETVNALGAMIQGGEKYAEMFKNNKAEEECNTCQALEDLWEDGVKSGIKKAVFMLRKVGTSDEVIVDMIKTEYNISVEEAQRYINESQNK